MLLRLVLATVEVIRGTTPLSWCNKRAILREEVLAIEEIVGAPLPKYGAITKAA